MKLRKQMVALLMAGVMLCSTLPVNTLAVENSNQNVEGLCEHHTEHNADCGYTEGIEGTPCTHEHNEDCYCLVTKCVHEHTEDCYPAESVSDNIATSSDVEDREPINCTHECSEDSGCIKEILDCKHEHDEICGYSPGTEGTPCAFVCEICNPQNGDDGQMPGADEQMQCTCTSLCTEESINGTCPVCGAEGADLSQCKGMEEQEKTCICTEPCTAEKVNKDCPVCGAEGADLSQCKGMEEQEKTCICTEPCTAEKVNKDCPVCGAENAALTCCMGKVYQVQAMIAQLPTVDELNAMTDEQKAEVLKQLEAIYAAMETMTKTELAKLDRTKLDALAYLVQEAAEIDRTIVADSAKLEGNGKINITKVSDKEYTISYPGVTKDTPLKYQEDFVNQLSHFSFSAMVTNADGSELDKQPHSLNINNTVGGLDYSEVTAAVASEDGSIPADANIPAGTYEMALDFSKITSNTPIVKDWKTIGFADSTQQVTINVLVGTEWDDSGIFDDYRIKTVTPDNVTFNLFDYWVDGETAHTHLNEGTHKDTLPTCGIPSCIGETNKVIKKNNVDGSGYESSDYYNKGINKNHALVFSPAGNKTGGWNFNTNNEQYMPENYEKFQGGPYYGLVKNTLGADGYPVLKLDKNEVDTKPGLTYGSDERPADESLAYLFDPDMSADGKAIYTDVGGLLKRDPNTGNYKYSSLENFASFNETENSFDVYNSWAVQGGDSIKGQFFPFNTAIQVFETDEDGNPVLNNGILVPNNANGSNDAFLTHYFGLTMEVTFQQPVGGKISNMGQEKPMHFRFSGDDDVWIFIDGVLVADIGGIHDTETATIDFSTGKIKIDRTDRFNDEPTEDTERSRMETTIREQFEKAGAIINNEMQGDTFADNTVHTLTLFYMERGNQASNLELEFNLQDPQYSTLAKVDQDGNGLEGIKFDLYKANTNWEPEGDAMATLITGKDGSVNLTKIGEDGVERVIVFEDEGHYLLREVETLPGYVTQGDIRLIYHAGTATLSVENKWETGAVGGFKAHLTMTDKLQSANGKDLTEEAQSGLIIAVPMYNPTNKGATATEGWIPLCGSTLDGFRAVEPDSISDEDYRKAALKAAFQQFANPNYKDWHLEWNDELERFEGTLYDLPASVERYIFVDRDNGDVLTAYYLLNPSDDLFDGCTTDKEKCVKLEALTKNGNIEELVNQYQKDLTLLNMDNFNRQFYSDLRIPNKVRELWIEKKDEAGNRLAGAEFTLYSDEACTKVEAKGVTDENGTISFSAQNEGSNGFSRVHYPLAQERDEVTGKLSEKKLWLKETKAPEGYACNETVTKILITNDYLYADAGTTYDNVSVARGLGRLVETMARYASDGVVNISLRDIKATLYKYTGASDDQGFPEEVTNYNNWWKAEPEKTLELHYGLDTSVLDYGLHDKTKVPVFEVEEDWYGIGVAQNWGVHTDLGDEYFNPNAVDENLTMVNISALFTGSTIIIYKDKTNTPGPGPETGNLSVSKMVSGDAGDQTKDWNFTVKLDKELSGQYGNMTFTDGVAIFTLKHGDSKTATGLPVGIKYTVTEAEANQDGYTTTSTDASGTITGDDTVVSFVNIKNDDKPVPDPKTGSLIVSKTVSGNRGDAGKDFHFTVTLGDTAINGQYGDMKFSNGVAGFTLKHGQSIKATGLPGGIRYTVTESDNAGYTVTASGDSGIIETGEIAAALFNNHRSGDGGGSGGGGGGGDNKVSVTVKKVWKLDDGGKAADSVAVVLLKDGKEHKVVELSDQNGWAYTWTGLRDRYTWTVAEVNVPEGFTAKVDRNGMTFTITNDDKPSDSDNPTAPDELNDPDAPTDPGKPSAPNEITDDIPQTGDETNLTLWLVLLGVSGMGVIITLPNSKCRYKGKHNKR